MMCLQAVAVTLSVLGAVATAYELVEAWQYQRRMKEQHRELLDEIFRHFNTTR
jgi:hypothetical protein